MKYNKGDIIIVTEPYDLKRLSANKTYEVIEDSDEPLVLGNDSRPVRISISKFEFYKSKKQIQFENEINEIINEV